MSNHLLQERDTDPGVALSETTPFKIPLRVLASLLGIVAAGAVAWGLTTNRVAEHEKRIESLEAESRKAEQLLIRIDERTSEIKRQLERPAQMFPSR